MSKGRIIVFVGLVILVVVARFVRHGEGQATPAPTGQASRPPATANPTPSASRPTPASPGASRPDSGPHEDIDPTAAAEAWVRAWLNTSGADGKPDKAAWLARLKPITEAQLYAGLAQTDITRVPEGMVAAGTDVQPVDGRADVTADVPTTAGDVLLTMTVQNERWVTTANDWAPGSRGVRA